MMERVSWNSFTVISIDRDLHDAKKRKVRKKKVRKVKKRWVRKLKRIRKVRKKNFWELVLGCLGVAMFSEASQTVFQRTSEKLWHHVDTHSHIK